MDANELRIGNYAIYGGNITQMNVGEFIHFVRFPETYSPVLLTEEWLLKLGFSKHSTNPFWFRKKQICISLVGAIELISWDMQIFKIDTKVNHVHQLQNLYLALTGEELEFII